MPESFEKPKNVDEKRTSPKIGGERILPKAMERLGIKIRYVPVRGYEYQKGFGFLKKKEPKINRREI